MKFRKLLPWGGIFCVAVAACSSGGKDEVPDVLHDLEYRLFDCRADPLPRRSSKIPLDCVLDAECTENLVTGHRGAGGQLGLFAPENSLSGVRLAILMGIDTIEIDVRDTADGRLVVMHDSSLERTTGVARRVDEMPLDEVVAVPLLVDGYLGDFSCERVPTFDQVLDLAKGRVNIDVDTKTDRADLVAIAIRDADMLDQAFVSTPSAESATLARATVPDVMIQARPKDLDDYQTAWSTLDRPAEIIEVDESLAGDFQEIARQAGSKLFVDGFFKDALVLTQGDTSIYLDVLGEGFDIIQSEYPHWVLEALGRKYWANWPEYRDIGIDSPLL